MKMTLILILKIEVGMVLMIDYSDRRRVRRLFSRVLHRTVRLSLFSSLSMVTDLDGWQYGAGAGTVLEISRDRMSIPFGRHYRIRPLIKLSFASTSFLSPSPDVILMWRMETVIEAFQNCNDRFIFYVYVRTAHSCQSINPIYPSAPPIAYPIRINEKWQERERAKQ